jgi:hypothetical protein
LKTGADQGAVSLRLSPGVVKYFRIKAPDGSAPSMMPCEASQGWTRLPIKLLALGWS